MEKNTKKIGGDVKEYLFTFNKNFTKIKRKENESDEHFLKRIVESRDTYLKEICEINIIELKGGIKNE